MTPWYAVHTLARKEALAAWSLKRLGYEVVFLHYFGRTKHARKTQRVLRPLFPRYIFCGVPNAHTVNEINRSHGVAAVVHLGEEPLPIPPDVIDELRSRGNASGLVPHEAETGTERRLRYRRGQQVRITTGPLEGLMAVVALDAGHQVRVWLDFIGGRVAAHLVPEDLESTSPERRSLPKRRLSRPAR